MSWVSVALHRCRLLVLTSSLLAWAPLSAGVVVNSTGPSAEKFPVGKKLPATERVTLRQGDVITVLDATGTRVLRGAGTYRVGGQGEEKRSTFAVLTRHRAAQRVRTGAVRSGPENNQPPNLWYVNVRTGGDVCVLSDQVMFWRADASVTEEYSVTNSVAGVEAPLVFEEGATTVSAPIAITPERSYTVTSPDGKEITELYLTPVPNNDYSVEDLAEVLILNNCLNQLDLLVKSMSAGEDEAE